MKHLMKSLGLAGLIVAALALPAKAQQQTVKLCIPTSPTACANVTASNPLPVSGSFSATLSGFAPATTGTPIAVTTGGVTGTLPAGTVVVATNVGTTNAAYCKLGASATTSDQYIAPNGGWFAFTVGASTQLTCITSTSTTTVNMVGGSGLATGTGGGGGSGGGGGGAVTMASGAVASGAYSSGSIASGAFASGSIASGAFASGSVSSGAYASGSLASGAVVDLTNLSTPITPATATATKGIMLGGQYNSTQATFTNGQQGSVQLSARGAVMVNPGAEAFNVANAGTFAVQAAQSGTWNVGTVTTVSTVTSLSQFAGNAINLGAGAVGTGTLRITQASDSPEIAVLGAQADSVCGSATGTCSLAALVKYLNNAAISATPAGTNLIGDVNLRQGGTALSATNPSFFRPTDATNPVVFDPCQVVAKTSITGTQTTGTQIITGSASKKTYICSFMIRAAAAEVWNIIAGTGSVCATGSSAVIGSTTAANGISEAANGGQTYGNGMATVFAATAVNADNLCLTQSGTSRLTWQLTYVQL